MIIVAVITFIMAVLMIIPTLTQVDLQGQPRAGTVEADPLEETRYRRFQLSPPSSSQLIFIRFQYYTRLQNQSGVNLDVLVSITHSLSNSHYCYHYVLLLIIVFLLITFLLFIIVLLLIIAEHPRARDPRLLLPNSVPRCLARRWQTEQHRHHVNVITIIVTIINTVIIMVTIDIITIPLNVNRNMPINVSCIRKALSLMAT